MLVVHTLLVMTKGLSYMQLVLHKDMDRTYTNKIFTYSQELAGDIDGYDETVQPEDEKFETEAGRFFNQNWAPVDESYERSTVLVYVWRRWIIRWWTTR